jgi:hypothetical protein
VPSAGDERYRVRADRKRRQLARLDDIAERHEEQQAHCIPELRQRGDEAPVWRPLRHEYHLTEKGGLVFYPVVLALRAWGETWCKSSGEGRAVIYTHRTCGKSVGLDPVCESCGKPLRREDLSAEQAPKYRREQEARMEAFKTTR